MRQSSKYEIRSKFRVYWALVQRQIEFNFLFRVRIESIQNAGKKKHILTPFVPPEKMSYYE